uniref:Eukaryotic translation initiation factor 3 subunit K n=2 Tax=Panstrongylus TaxID=65342 RepID=A0A069DPL7_9HEMI
MAEVMRQTVASMLQGIDRYNPDNLSTLERYVEIQSQENAYDLEANLAVLKLYQFNQNYNKDITCQILLKALTNFPHTDFILCKCLLNQTLCEESPIKEIITLADCLECCDFEHFWKEVNEMQELCARIIGFQDSIRKFVCHVVGITFQTIQRSLLSQLLGGVDDHTLKHWVQKYGWKEIANNMIFIANQDENIKTKNITEKIDFDSVAGIMATCR